MSGRALWEAGLAGKGGEDEEDDGEDAITEGMRKVKVEEE